MSTEKKRETEERRNNAFHSSVQVRLGKEDLFFGPGKARLMEYIEETGSMQEACTKMELSYSKASKMMKKAEKQLGFKLLERRIGGSGGGGSRLTEEGRDLSLRDRTITRIYRCRSALVLRHVLEEDKNETD